MIHPDTRVVLVDDYDSAGELMRWLSQVKTNTIAYDTETQGLDPRFDKVRLIQFGDSMNAFALPTEGTRAWGGLAREVLDKWPGWLVMHNASFDVAMMDAFGYRIPRNRVHDTRLMGHILEPHASTALKSQASRHVDKKAAGLARALDDCLTKNGWTWATVPIESEGPAAIYWQYGCLDVVLTHQLFEHHYPLVMAEAPAAYDLEMAVSWVTEKMERKGVAVDRRYAAAKSQEFLAYVEQSGNWIEHTYGFKPASNAGIIRVLEADGVELTKRTPGGAICLDRDVLGAIDHPLIHAILTRRRVQKLEGSFLKAFLALSEYDGLLHPRINTIGGQGKKTGESGGGQGVPTGRMSMDSPNLQGLPRVSSANPPARAARNCIVPRDPNNSLLLSDFDQIEMRLLAHFTEDPGMQGAFAGDVDFFTALARQIYQDGAIEKSDDRRSTTKNAAYATAYGAGTEKFAATAGISLVDAQVFMDAFHRTYPGLKRFMDSTSRDAHRLGYVTSTLTGRQWKAEEGLEYKLMNHRIQGTAAEIFKTKLLELDAKGLGDYLVLPVHDEVILDVPDSELADVAALVNEVMNDDKLLSVPITAGISVAKRWGEKRAF